MKACFCILNQSFVLMFCFQAFLIAFTSTFLPKLLYRFAISDDNSLKGYLNFSLAWSPPNTTAVPCRFVKCRIYIMKILDLMCKIRIYSYIYIYAIFHGIMGFVLYLRVTMMNLRFNETSVVLK